MRVHEWSILHSYASYQGRPITNLDEIAYQVVNDGVAVCSLERESGKVWLRTTDGVVAAITTFQQDEASGSFNISLERLDGVPIDQSDECYEWWFHAAVQRAWEIHGLSGSHAPNYIRIQLDEIICHAGAASFVLYPSIKVYITGSCIVSFRSIGREFDLSISEFVDDYVNLGLSHFSSFDVPVLLMSKMEVAKIFWASSKFRRSRTRSWNKIENAIRKYYSGGSELRDLAQSNVSVSSEDGFESLVDVLGGMLALLDYYANCSRSPMWFGHSNAVLFGDSWTGEPFVFVVKHSDQNTLGSDNDEFHREAIDIMLTRNSHVGEQRHRQDAINLRNYQDCSIFVSSSIALVLWSLSGVQKLETGDARSHDHADYVYSFSYIFEQILFLKNHYKQAVEHIAIDEKGVNALILAERAHLTELHISELSSYGEIREIVEAGLRASNVEKYQEKLIALTELRRAKSEIVESHSVGVAQVFFAILAVVIAIPPLMDIVIYPALTSVGVDAPKAPIVPIVIMGVFLAIGWAVFWITKKLINRKYGP